MKTPRPSSWMLLSEFSGGKRTWQAYRLKDAGKPDTSENREFFGKPGTRRECVMDVVKALNEGELQARHTREAGA